MKTGSKAPRSQRTQAQWTTVLRQYHNSELTQTAFCETHGIAISSFTKALRREREAPTIAGSGEGFLPVVVERTAELCESVDWDVELTLGAGCVLRIRSV